MCTIREQEEKLFAEWIKHEEWIHREDWIGMSDCPVEDFFCRDGLHFTGEPERHQEGDSVWWTMKGDGKQEELWKKAFIKPVFLCKDHNGYETVDVREETGYSGDLFYSRFYKKYLVLLYALANYNQQTNVFPSFEEASHIDNFWQGEKGFFHTPVVRINLKKISGGSSCSNRVLEKYNINDKPFIDQQREIYKGANVFVCCHGGENWNPIWDLLTWKESDYGWFPDLKPYEPSRGYIWYSPSKKVIVIWEYHMSDRVSSWEYYQAIPYLKEFFEAHKGFLE